MIGRSLWRARGALALRRDGAGFVIDSARPPNFDRPWAPNVAPNVAQQAARGGAANSDAAPPAASRSQPRDATPRPEDLDPSD